MKSSANRFDKPRKSDLTVAPSVIIAIHVVVSSAYSLKSERVEGSSKSHPELLVALFFKG